MDPSWTVIAVLVTFNMWLFFSDPARFIGLSTGAALALAALSAALFFGSILVHELAHAGVSIARGIPVSGITLWMFGGATHAKAESRGPADEFLVTVVGPGTSLALGALFLAAHSFGRDATGQPVSAMFGYLAFINFSLGVFNLLPGFPLDGGRLLRSALWRVTGSLSRATEIAARVGQAIGGLIIAFALVLAARGGGLQAVWAALIGWFLFRAASATLSEGRGRKLLESVTARQIMAAPPPTIDADLPISKARERYLDGHEGEAFPVVQDSRVIGFVSLKTAARAAPDQAVRSAMVGTAGTFEAAPDDRMDAVSARISEHPGGTVLVVEEGRLVGVIEPEDISRYLKAGRARPGGLEP